MSELPEGWGICALEEISSLITKGTTPTTIGFNYEKTGISFVKIENIANNRIHKSSINQFISEEAHTALLRSQLQENDVLFSIAGTIGKTALVKQEDLPANTNQAVAIIRVPHEITSYSFLQHQLSSLSRDFLADISRGGAMSNVSLGDIKNFELRIPPLAEQTRIAQKLDELLAQVDTLKARIDAIPALLKRFRQSVLAAAVCGRLTSEWRATLIENSSWNSLPLGSLCANAFDGPFGSKLKSDDYTSEGARVVRLENIGHLNFIGEKKTFIGLVKLSELSRNTLRAGDILFSSFVDEEIRVCRLPKSEETFINKADCFCLRIDEFTADPAFVMYALAAKHTYQRIKESVHGATRPRINLGFLKSFEIRLPSLAEQTEIVRRVEQLFAFAGQLEAKVASAKSRIDHLTQSILAKAFRGELVPQDPNDEPASVLLERIKAQRAAAPKAKRGRKASA